MISHVSFEKTQYNVLPYKFEAGTPNMAGVIGLGAAIDYVSQVGIGLISEHEHALTQYALHQLKQVDNLTIIGSVSDRVGVISFVLDGIHPHDIGTVLDSEGIAIRVGHHCAMPLIESLHLPATARASFGLYNNESDVDALIQGLHQVNKLLG